MTNIFGNPPPIESLIPRLVRAYLASPVKPRAGQMLVVATRP